MTLPISVIMPTRNCLHRLKRHVSLNQDWFPHVAEIIVVDSYSEDGSLDFLRHNLVHPNLKFFSHPPGLYESWNFGINQSDNPYTYISTSGDIITLEGLIHLLESIEKLQCDVIVSPPRFEREGVGEIRSKRWPIHKIIDLLNIENPTIIPPAILLDLMLCYLDRALLGSSASNLYKSRSLKEYPFPVDYGQAGDAAWGILYNHQVSFGVTPRVFSCFLLHDKEEGRELRSIEQNPDPREGLTDILQKTFNEYTQYSPDTSHCQFKNRRRIIETRREVVRRKTLYRQSRDKKHLFSYRNLRALGHRAIHRKRRKQLKDLIHSLEEEMVSALRSECC